MNKAEKFIGRHSHISASNIEEELVNLTELSSLKDAESSLLKVNLKLNGIPITALIDSGAAGNFVSSKFLKENNLNATTSRRGCVALADGRLTDSLGSFRGILSDDRRYLDSLNFTVVPIRYDLILGKPWLTLANPYIDWRQNVLTFTFLDRLNVWNAFADNLESSISAIDLDESPDISLISAKQLERECSSPDTDDVFIVSLSCVGLYSQVPSLSSIDSTSCDEAAVISSSLKHEFSDVFPDEIPSALPPNRHVDHAIDLVPDATPHSQAPYRMSHIELEELRRQLRVLIDRGFISPSTSPWGAPVLLVKKKNGSMRFCVDYRALNKRTVKNRYPLPHIEDSLQRLYKSKYFTAIDLHSAYHQILIRKEDRFKTAFNTRYGHYEFNVVPFGLTNAPATFQTLMNDLMRPFLDDFVIVYLDDILIFSDTLENHELHVRKVLNILRREKLYANPSKSTLFATSLLYLGHEISHRRIAPDPSKIASIESYPIPQTRTELRAFIGLCNFYRKFIRNFSSVVIPLTDLTKSSEPFVWTDEHTDAFRAIKDLMTSSPVLMLPDPTLPFRMETDSSDFALGGVLLQKSNGKWHPVMYHSRKLNPAERNYPIHEKELLALVDAFRQWRHFLHGNCVHAYTDHKSIIHLVNQKRLSGRQARWMEFLSEFDFEIHYKKGQLNIVADALSRRPDYSISVLSFLDGDGSRFVDQLKAAYPDDSYFGRIFKYLKNGGPIPKSERELLSIASWYVLENDLLYYVRQPSLRRLCIPRNSTLLKNVLYEAHDSRLSGHAGFNRTYKYLRQRFFWPGMSKDIRSYILGCPSCQSHKPMMKKYQGPLQPLDIPSRPWESISMDFIMDLPLSKSENTAMVVFVDRFSKSIRVEPMKTTASAPDVAKIFFDTVFRNFGLPRSIISDRDPRFISSFWKSLFKMLDTKLHMSTSFHPQSDGQTEIMNRTLETMIRHYVDYKLDNWDENLYLLEFAYNSAVNMSSGFSPFYLCQARHPRSPLTSILPESTNVKSVEDFVSGLQSSWSIAYDTISESQERQAHYANQHRVVQDFQVDDYVLLSSKNIRLHVNNDAGKKLRPKFLGPFRIVEKTSLVNYKLELPPSLSKIHPVFHCSLLRLYVRRDPMFDDSKAEQIMPDPIFIEGDENEYFVVEKILDKRKRRGKWYYLIKWKDYPLHDASWEPVESIASDVPMLARQFENDSSVATVSDNLRYPSLSSVCIDPTCA